MSSTISQYTKAAPISAVPPQPVSRNSGDLRTFIRRLDDAGRLVHVTEAVDWKFEIGKITREHQTPLLFENILDCPGQQVFTNGLCDLRSIALALGLPSTTSRNALVREASKRIAKPIAPKLVETGSVLENIVLTPHIDLFRIPVPWWHPDDTDRYIGTWHVNISRDPETSCRNLGVYRMQLLGPTRTTVSACGGSHLGRHVKNAEKMGEALPMAVAIGVNESLVMAGASALPYGMDEFVLAGALQQETVELVRCQTVDLEVPAHCELVIEGWIHPGVRVQDGPYFDYSGRTNVNPNAYLFEATCLMFRNASTFRGTSVGMPGGEDHQLFAFLAALGLVDFHGSRSRQIIQNFALRHHMFRSFQFSGILGSWLHGKH
jgi:4-hydroxy-3-polyprenylbenzoate decarboxylase